MNKAQGRGGSSEDCICSFSQNSSIYNVKKVTWLTFYLVCLFPSVYLVRFGQLYNESVQQKEELANWINTIL